ncbi:MAG: hypothetical protein Greene041662_281 [Candidatus Peregrinibacteria bacterium Greene0416_62]|nr:MAG: hypothetical protein Greene041662_281 [Candidatus Peregrinibacteria bacterium Greene0416_62]TSC99234.1 MAG: hypothetical protein Greene101449_692 [Candidatus Peregrinibacteria bacterium Greene1014_49]
MDFTEKNAVSDGDGSSHTQKFSRRKLLQDFFMSAAGAVLVGCRSNNNETTDHETASDDGSGSEKSEPTSAIISEAEKGSALATKMAQRIAEECGEITLNRDGDFAKKDIILEFGDYTVMMGFYLSKANAFDDDSSIGCIANMTFRQENPAKRGLKNTDFTVPIVISADSDLQFVGDKRKGVLVKGKKTAFKVHAGVLPKFLDDAMEYLQY